MKSFYTRHQCSTSTETDSQPSSVLCRLQSDVLQLELFQIQWQEADMSDLVWEATDWEKRHIATNRITYPRINTYLSLLGASSSLSES